VRIPVRSRRQANEWSLVLISQGIECAIDHSDPEGGWGLIVSPNDHARALEVLRQYQLENRGWSWQQPVLGPGIRFDWGSLAWAFLLGVFYWLDAQHNLSSAGVVDSSAVARGQWWRLFTATWLHADLGHLSANAVLGTGLLGLVMGRYGTGIGLAAACLCGAAGNVASCWLFGRPHLSLGASGTVMGALGLLTVQGVVLWKRSRKAVMRGLMAGLMLFILLGLAPKSDIIAHAGGFVGGVLLGALLNLAGDRAKDSIFNWLAGMLFALMVTIPWWLALAALRRSA
jgi:rhomboid protease GluP